MKHVLFICPDFMYHQFWEQLRNRVECVHAPTISDADSILFQNGNNSFDAIVWDGFCGDRDSYPGPIQEAWRRFPDIRYMFASGYSDQTREAQMRAGCTHNVPKEEVVETLIELLEL